MKGYLYILKSERINRFYIGSSNNPEKRLTNQHNKSLVRSTKPGVPWIIVFKQEYPDLTIARKIEYRLKKLKSRVIVKKITRDGFCKIQVD